MSARVFSFDGSGQVTVVSTDLDLSGGLSILQGIFQSTAGNAGSASVGEIALTASLACAQGNMDALRKVLKGTAGRGLDGTDAFGKAFKAACSHGRLEAVRELLALRGKQAIDVHLEDWQGPEAGFRHACASGNVDLVRELLALKGHRTVDVHAWAEGAPEAAFRVACQYDRLAVVRELLALRGSRFVNVHADEEHGLRGACAEGCLAVVRELLALTGAREVDVHAMDEYAFRLACERGHVDIVCELLSLTGHRAVPLQTRRAAGEVAVQLGKDAVWGGTSTRQGRGAMVVFRAGRGR